MTAEEEAPKDPGAFKPHASVTDNEILGESAFPFPVNTKNLSKRCKQQSNYKILGEKILVTTENKVCSGQFVV